MTFLVDGVHYHTPSYVTAWECPYCREAFALVGDCITHIVGKHKDEAILNE